jgi:hypothetical protein
MVSALGLECNNFGRRLDDRFGDRSRHLAIAAGPRPCWARRWAAAARRDPRYEIRPADGQGGAPRGRLAGSVRSFRASHRPRSATCMWNSYKERAATAECANAQARNQYAQDRRGVRAHRESPRWVMPASDATCRTMLGVRACHSAMVLTLSMLRTRNCVSPRYVLGRWRTPRSRPAPCRSFWRRHRPYGFASRHARRIAGLRGMAVSIGVAQLGTK